MTVHEAIDKVRSVGTIWAESGKLKLRFPGTEQARLEPAIETLRHEREAALQTVIRTESELATIPPAAKWPQSLSELAAQVGQHSADPEAARREVWIEWCESKARALNHLFQEQGLTGQPGRITPATVRHGLAAERSR